MDSTLLPLPGGLAMNTAPVSARPERTRFDRAEDRRLEDAVLADDARAIGDALRAGADANAPGRHQTTPLMIAVAHQRPNAVSALLHSGADPDAMAADGNTAVTLAIEGCRTRPHGHAILATLLEAGGDPDSRRPDGDPVICRFIEDRDADGIRLMRSFGADLDIRDRDDDPLITRVAVAQHWDMVWALIELGARYDYENGASRRPLSMALSLAPPAPDSPHDGCKLKVWRLMKDLGLPVEAMPP